MVYIYHTGSKTREPVFYKCFILSCGVTEFVSILLLFTKKKNKDYYALEGSSLYI